MLIVQVWVGRDVDGLGRSAVAKEDVERAALWATCLDCIITPGGITAEFVTHFNNYASIPVLG